MVQPWWAAGLAIPVVIGKGLLGGRNKQKKVESSREREDDGGEPMFACERVCTSDRLQRKLGGLSKDPYPNTCVTVCGVSETDACTEACQRTVCVNAHQVPAWNDSCLKRCTTECLRGRSS